MRKSLFLLLPLVVTNAHAVYVDVRHEYLDDSKANYDRAYISHRFANGVGFAIEAISKSGGMTPIKRLMTRKHRATNIR